MQHDTSRKTAWEMAGEFFREAAVLVCVFGFLEPFVAGKAITWPQVALVLAVTILCMVAGVRIELRRDTKKVKEADRAE